MLGRMTNFMVSVMAICAVTGSPAFAAQSNVNSRVARAVSAQKANNNTQHAVASRSAIKNNSRAIKTDTRSVSGRTRTTTVGTRGRSGILQSGVMPSFKSDKVTPIKLYVSDQIAQKYPRLSAYKDMFGGEYIVLLKVNGVLPDLSGLITKMGKKNVRLSGIYSSDAPDAEDVVYSSTGAVESSANATDEVFMVEASCPSGADNAVVAASLARFNTSNSHAGWTYYKVFSNGDTKCKLIVKDKTGTCWTDSTTNSLNSDGEYKEPDRLVYCDIEEFNKEEWGNSVSSSWKAVDISLNWGQSEDGILTPPYNPTDTHYGELHVELGKPLPSLSGLIKAMTPPKYTDPTTNAQLPKVFAGIYGNNNVMYYDANGNWNGTTITKSDKVAQISGKLYLSMHWSQPDATPDAPNGCPGFVALTDEWNNIKIIRYVRAENPADRKSDNTDCAIIYQYGDGDFNADEEFYRMARYKVQPAKNGRPAISAYTYGFYEAPNSSWNIMGPCSSEVVSADRNRSDVDREITIHTRVTGTCGTCFDGGSNGTEAIDILVDYDKTLPSMKPLIKKNSCYAPQASFIAGYSELHMTDGGRPCDGIDHGVCVTPDPETKYWGDNGDPIRTVSGSSDVSDMYLYWNGGVSVAASVEYCPVPTGIACGSEDAACENAQRYPRYWTVNGLMPNVNQTYIENATFVRNVVINQLNNGMIGDCAAIIRDGDGLCWISGNDRDCDAGAGTCFVRAMDCDLNKYELADSNGYFQWSAGGTYKRGISVGWGKIVTPTNPDGLTGIPVLYQWEGESNGREIVFPDLSTLVTNMEHYVQDDNDKWVKETTKHFAGINSRKDGGGFWYYNQNGVPTNSSMMFNDVPYGMYMIWRDDASYCPDYADTVATWNSNGAGIDASAVKLVSGRFSSEVSDCAIIFRDADGFCRMARYDVENSRYGATATMFGPTDRIIKDCNKGDSYLDYDLPIVTNTPSISTHYTGFDWGTIYVGIELASSNIILSLVQVPSLATYIAMAKAVSSDVEFLGVGRKKPTRSGNSVPVPSDTTLYWDTTGTLLRPIGSLAEINPGADNEKFYMYWDNAPAGSPGSNGDSGESGAGGNDAQTDFSIQESMNRSYPGGNWSVDERVSNAQISMIASDDGLCVPYSVSADQLIGGVGACDASVATGVASVITGN